MVSEAKPKATKAVIAAQMEQGGPAGYARLVSNPRKKKPLIWLKRKIIKTKPTF